MTPPTPFVAVAPLRPPLVLVRSVPVARRPWRVMLVPQTPGAPTRAFDVARWQARLALGALSILVLFAGGAVTATIVAVRTPEFFASGAELAALRHRLTTVQDSLSVVRATLALAEATKADSVSAPPPPAARITPGTMTLRRPALLPRPRASANSAPPEDDASGAESSGAASSGMEGLPVIGTIASRFSTSRRHPILHILRPHLGLDIAAPRGTRITAPAPGRVSFVGRKFAFGLVVEIEHADGMKTRYAHCRTAMVKAGDLVKRGMTIATVGSSGLTTGPHLHYEMLHNGRQVDPLRFHLRQPVDSSAASGIPPAQPAISPATSAAVPPATTTTTVPVAQAASSPAPAPHPDTALTPGEPPPK